jgi:hypothetical protein
MTAGNQPSSGGSETAIVFWYKNYKGEQGYRRAVPISIRYGTSDYHRAPQWLMLAFDTEKEAEREFAMADMSHNVLGDQIVLRFVSVAQPPVGCGDPSCKDPNCTYGQDEPVSYRWRQPGNKHWIYDPTPEWIEDHKHEIELEPLYAVTPSPGPDREGTLKMVAGLFSESVHDTYTREEVVSIVEDMIRVGCPESSVASKISPGDPVEVRKVGDEIDEIVIRRGDVHIEQMDDSGWFMGVDASDGSYWQFWFGAKNRKSHVHFRHTETVPSTPCETVEQLQAEVAAQDPLGGFSDADRAAIRKAPTGPWAEGCPNYPGCKCDDICIDWGGSPLTSTHQQDAAK